LSNPFRLTIGLPAAVVAGFGLRGSQWIIDSGQWIVGERIFFASLTSFQYAHLDSHSTDTAEFITLKFLGMEPVKVAIRGRNLWRLYDYIHQHRVAWIMQASRDFAQDGQTIISQVTFAAVKEGEQND
jgi:hypothetical protein